MPAPPPTSKRRSRCRRSVALAVVKPHVGVVSLRLARSHSAAASVDLPAPSHPSRIQVCSAPEEEPAGGAGPTLAERRAVRHRLGLSGADEVRRDGARQQHNRRAIVDAFGYNGRAFTDEEFHSQNLIQNNSLEHLSTG